MPVKKRKLSKCADLFFKKKSGWEGITEKDREKIFFLSEEYKNFLNLSKTERETINTIWNMAKHHGFVKLDVATNETKKIVLEYSNTSSALAVVNDPKKILSGFSIICTHIDTPHLDLKPFPLFEKEHMGYMKTHYYGGIKKYQWVTRPLSLHGIVVLQNGKKIDIVIGEDESDPVFTINDLLPHLAKDQYKKKSNELIEAEQLNILVGSIPYKFKIEEDSVKCSILSILNDKYGITEQDFVSSELQLVPSGASRDVGLDRSFVGAHGQDDRICSFLAMKALFDVSKCDKNLMVVFFDKEEVGSLGNTGARSDLLERIINDILQLYNNNEHNTLIKALKNSKIISADVNTGIDPEWKDVNEEMNAAKMGFGVCLTKFTGSGGKFNTNDANAEFVASLRRAFNIDGVRWQTASLGKVDQGGGGTIAGHLARYGADVVDCGPALLSMHSPFEISSKVDIYHTLKAYKAFYNYI